MQHFKNSQWLVALLAIALLFPACATLRPFAPALTVTGIALLQELETLLLDYQSSHQSTFRTPAQLDSYVDRRRALKLIIVRHLEKCEPHVPAPILDDYRRRFLSLPPPPSSRVSWLS